jgi:hypothetical protein
MGHLTAALQPLPEFITQKTPQDFNSVLYPKYQHHNYIFLNILASPQLMHDFWIKLVDFYNIQHVFNFGQISNGDLGITKDRTQLDQQSSLYLPNNTSLPFQPENYDFINDNTNNNNLATNNDNNNNNNNLNTKNPTSNNIIDHFNSTQKFLSFIGLATLNALITSILSHTNSTQLRIDIMKLLTKSNNRDQQQISISTLSPTLFIQGAHSLCDLQWLGALSSTIRLITMDFEPNCTNSFQKVQNHNNSTTSLKSTNTQSSFNSVAMTDSVVRDNLVNANPSDIDITNFHSIFDSFSQDRPINRNPSSTLTTTTNNTNQPISLFNLYQVATTDSFKSNSTHSSSTVASSGSGNSNEYAHFSRFLPNSSNLLQSSFSSLSPYQTRLLIHTLNYLIPTLFKLEDDDDDEQFKTGKAQFDQNDNNNDQNVLDNNYNLLQQLQHPSYSHIQKILLSMNHESNQQLPCNFNHNDNSSNNSAQSTVNLLYIFYHNFYMPFYSFSQQFVSKLIPLPFTNHFNQNLTKSLFQTSIIPTINFACNITSSMNPNEYHITFKSLTLDRQLIQLYQFLNSFSTSTSSSSGIPFNNNAAVINSQTLNPDDNSNNSDSTAKINCNFSNCNFSNQTPLSFNNAQPYISPCQVIVLPAHIKTFCQLAPSPRQSSTINHLTSLRAFFKSQAMAIISTTYLLDVVSLGRFVQFAWGINQFEEPSEHQNQK